MSKPSAPPKNADYFFVDLDHLKVGVTLPVAIYLYFKRNDHIIQWIKSGDEPPADRIERFRKHGLKAIWIRNADRSEWEKYLRESDEISSAQHLAPANDESVVPELAKASADSAPTPELAAATTLTEATPEFAQAAQISEATPELAPESRHEKSENIIAKLEDPSIADPKIKAAMVAREARKSLDDTLNNTELEKQSSLNAETRRVAQEVLSAMGEEVTAMIGEIWKMADLDPALTHSVNVASYSVLFALGFGKVEPALLSDLARAGLFHDFGVSQVPAHIAQKAWSQQTLEERKIYESHVAESVRLARQFEPTLSERTLMMIGQTHEKFNGKGYPAQLEGFKLDPSAQVVAIAEMLDSIASGAFDGTRRTYQEALLMLEKFEQNTNFPEHFNPDIFRTVLKWVKRADQGNIAKDALALVQVETAAIVKDDPKAA